MTHAEAEVIRLKFKLQDQYAAAARCGDEWLKRNYYLAIADTAKRLREAQAETQGI